MSYWCGLCNTRFKYKHCHLLSSLTPHIRDAYPVEPRYASTSTTYHIDKWVTILYDDFLNTYSIGDHISRCLYRVINEDYKDRVTRYFSLWSEAKRHCPAVYADKEPKPYPVKDGRFILHKDPTYALVMLMRLKALSHFLELATLTDTRMSCKLFQQLLLLCRTIQTRWWKITIVFWMRTQYGM